MVQTECFYVSCTHVQYTKQLLSYSTSLAHSRRFSRVGSRSLSRARPHSSTPVTVAQRPLPGYWRFGPIIQHRHCVKHEKRTKTHLPNVDARITFAKGVTVAELGNDRNGVEPSVLGERRRDDLERVGICLEAVCLHAGQGLRVLRQHARYVDLWCATATDQRTTTKRGRRVSEDVRILSWISLRTAS